MRNIMRVALIITFLGLSVFSHSYAQISVAKSDETIFVYGGDINLKFVQYVVDLTKKESPIICYLPTASADNQDNIKFWEYICKTIGIEPIILKVWVSSSPTNRSFEDYIMTSDAVVVGGGNTLNMLGLWKAQGIDTLLHNALKEGVILSGGSAGSICWFQKGISDSRPVSLSVVDGLGFLPYSNCPHYSEEPRRDMFHQKIIDNEITFGYASDNLAGILFKNGEAIESVSQSDIHNSYYVTMNDGSVQSTIMGSRILLKKGALLENEFSSLSVKKSIWELLQLDDISGPVNAYLSVIKANRLNPEGLTEKERESVLGISVESIFLYDNRLAGVVNNAYGDFYGMWYFYNNNGVWESLGEDLAGETLFEGEIVFREKAKIMAEKGRRGLEK
jgi:peptidase E